MRCLIVVPTYDEAATLPGLLHDLETLRGGLVIATIDVLVVDDDSPDGTADVVRAHDGFGDWLHLLSRPRKAGLGAAYRAGFAAALDGGYDVAVQMDADGSHPTAQIPSMLALLSSHDVVVGSRYAGGGMAVDWPVRRRALSRVANLYARSVLRLRTRDVTSGFRAWWLHSLLSVGILETSSDGYGFQVENTWRAERLGLRLVEHPIVFTDRTAGRSKMSAGVAREAMELVLRWRLGELRTPRRAPHAVTGRPPGDRREGLTRR